MLYRDELRLFGLLCVTVSGTDDVVGWKQRCNVNTKHTYVWFSWHSVLNEKQNEILSSHVLIEVCVTAEVVAPGRIGTRTPVVVRYVEHVTVMQTV